MKELLLIQQSLSVPKGQRNDFNHFNYRSLEDILEAAKPILKNLECSLKITDELVNIGERYYIKATATLTNKDDHSEVGIGYAREAENQKGMDSAQLTGSTSSYARKYACNGLLLIDDNADPDSNAFQKLKEKESAPKPDPHEAKISSELGGRDMTAEADACKNLAELAVWYGNLASEYKKEGSPVIAIKDARKKAIQFEQGEAEKSSPAKEALKHVQEIKKGEGQIDYSFESLKTKTVAVLKQIAKEMDIAGFSKMDKPTLITKIIKTRG